MDRDVIEKEWKWTGKGNGEKLGKKLFFGGTVGSFWTETDQK